LDFGAPVRSLSLRLDLELRDQRAFVGELVRPEFGIDECAIHAYIEDPARTSNQGWFYAERVFELGSQTGRRWQVVSGAAIGDANIHSKDLLRVWSPWRWRW